MNAMRSQGFSGLIGVGRSDITPSPGVYARCWGASKSDRMKGIHRPLTATALAFASDGGNQGPLILLAMDGSWWQADDERSFRRHLLERFSLNPAGLMVNLSHSHAAPPLTTILTDRPGGDLLAEYTQNLAGLVAPAIEEAISSMQPGFLSVSRGYCDLAHLRDFRVGPEGRPLVGMSPGTEADTLLIALHLTDRKGRTLAIGANYACHATTLGFENDQISPDFVGAFRETVEAANPGAYAFFLQGASGDLAPPYQYHGETAVADNYGRKLAYSTLAALTGIRSQPLQLQFSESIQSGADLAMWRPEHVELDSTCLAKRITVPLGIKLDFPTVPALTESLSETGEGALHERLRRKLGLRYALGDRTTCEAGLWLWRVGDLLLAGAPFEAYLPWQTTVRARFPGIPVVMMNLVNGSLGYLPADAHYDDPRLYAVWQTPFERGGLEQLITHTIQGFSELLQS